MRTPPIAEICWEIVYGQEKPPTAAGLAERSSRAAETAHTLVLKEFKAESIDFVKQAGNVAWLINSTLVAGIEFYVKDTIEPSKMYDIPRNKVSFVDNWGLQRILKRDFYKICYDGKELISAYINRLPVLQQ